MSLSPAEIIGDRLSALNEHFSACSYTGSVVTQKLNEPAGISLFKKIPVNLPHHVPYPVSDHGIVFVIFHNFLHGNIA